MLQNSISINVFAKKAFLIEKFALLAYKANLLKGKKHRKEHNYTAQPQKGRKQNGGSELIDYKPFWETLKQSEETTYTLVTRHRISGATIDKLRKNKPVNTTTLDGLCGIFECALQDIVRYVPDGKENGMKSARGRSGSGSGNGRQGGNGGPGIERHNRPLRKDQ